MNTTAPDTLDYRHLLEMVQAQYQLDLTSIHGIAHWRRVERFGLTLAEKTGANIAVVRLFAIFHDAKRLNDGTDDAHGRRAADFIQQLHGIHFKLFDEELLLLLAACTGHTDGRLSPDPTIGTCWDADRLDLGRVGIIPTPFFMSTAYGKQIAQTGSTYPGIGGDSK